MSKVKVSIITATYNSMKYMDNLLASTNNQSFQDWEVIFVDDGSNDGTREYSEQYCSHNSKFKLVKKVAEGSPAESRIEGLKHAEGEYVVFCDHDDFWHPKVRIR